MSDVTRILGQIESGDPKAAEELLPLVYEELRKLSSPVSTHCRPCGKWSTSAPVSPVFFERGSRADAYSQVPRKWSFLQRQGPVGIVWQIGTGA